MDQYPKIYIRQTDEELPDPVPEGYERYTDFKAFNQGGTAKLMTCKDKLLGRRVIFKTMLPHIRENKIEVKRFLREARVTAQLQHPNTPPVYDLGRDAEGNPYFTMKLIMGQTLRGILEKLYRKDPETENEFTLNRLLGIMIQTSNAIAFAHEHGVIHRDIKPANIEIGTFGEVIVLDWGLAKVWKMPPEELSEIEVEETEGSKEITQLGKRQGTPLYMSPEQARCVSDIDERTDIFSLGSVLYEILTLRNMFVGRDITQIMIKLKNEDPIPPSERNEERFVPERLEEICLKAVAREREKRYQNVLDFVADLREYRQDILMTHTDS